MGIQLCQLAISHILGSFLGVLSVLTDGWNSQEWPERKSRLWSWTLLKALRTQVLPASTNQQLLPWGQVFKNCVLESRLLSSKLVTSPHSHIRQLLQEKSWQLKKIMTNMIKFIIKLASWAQAKKQRSKAAEHKPSQRQKVPDKSGRRRSHQPPPNPQIPIVAN